MLCLCLALAGSPVAAMDKLLALGTSSPSGVYSPVGKGICKLVNEGRLDHGVRCNAYNTGGSVYNVLAIVSGELDVAITRSDLVVRSHEGSAPFDTFGKIPQIRFITALYDNPVAVIAKADSDIKTFDDFLGQRINIGNMGSGKRSVSDMLFEITKWKHDDFSTVLELGTSKMGKAFCKGEVDILINAMGMPDPFYDNLVNDCGAVFLDIPQSIMGKVLQQGPYFVETKIPAGLYESNPKDIRTFGNKAVLITSSRVHEDTIYLLTKAIFDDLERFNKIHPALTTSTPASMLRGAIDVPIHPGAARYYKENEELKRWVNPWLEGPEP